MAPKDSELLDELSRYLNSDPEHVDDVLKWWWERRNTYPRLSRMALNYLTIPGKVHFILFEPATKFKLATSVDVEQIFSRGRLLLSHVRSRLSAQST